jgi:hypothetical protein
MKLMDATTVWQLSEPHLRYIRIYAGRIEIDDWKTAL